MHDVSMTVDSDLNGPNPQFSLTCVSTGGPATTVTWTRDSTTVTEGTETVLDDPVTAHYTHTLTVSGKIPGLYSCTVKNNKPSIMSTNFTLKCLYKPFLFHSKQFSLSFSGPDTNQLEVCGSEWLYQCPTDLDSTLSTTGYMISYTGGGVC